MEPSQSHEKKQEQREGKRRIVFRLCSVKGEITHLLIFFFPKDGHHRSYVGIYEPISNMKYRHQESILPLFFTSLFSQQITAASLAQVKATNGSRFII